MKISDRKISGQNDLIRLKLLQFLNDLDSDETERNQIEIPIVRTKKMRLPAVGECRLICFIVFIPTRSIPDLVQLIPFPGLHAICDLPVFHLPAPHVYDPICHRGELGTIMIAVGMCLVILEPARPFSRFAIVMGIVTERAGLSRGLPVLGILARCRGDLLSQPFLVGYIDLFHTIILACVTSIQAIYSSCGSQTRDGMGLCVRRAHPMITMQHLLIGMHRGSQFWNNRGVRIFRICCGCDNTPDSSEQASGRKVATLSRVTSNHSARMIPLVRIILHYPSQINKDFGHFKRLRERGTSRTNVTRRDVKQNE